MEKTAAISYQLLEKISDAARLIKLVYKSLEAIFYAYSFDCLDCFTQKEKWKRG